MQLRIVSEKSRYIETYCSEMSRAAHLISFYKFHKSSLSLSFCLNKNDRICQLAKYEKIRDPFRCKKAASERQRDFWARKHLAEVHA